MGEVNPLHFQKVLRLRKDSLWLAGRALAKAAMRPRSHKGRKAPP